MHQKPSLPRRIVRGAKCLAPLASLLLLSLAVPGCGPNSLHSEQGSPIVSADSEAGKKAQAEAEKLLEIRKKQEAQAGKRKRMIPDPG